MQQRNICLDFKSIFSPYLVASALAARAQGQIDKIYAPLTAQFFEVWSDNLPRPVTFHLNDSAEGDTLLGFSRLYGFNSENVDAHDVFSALHIFHSALRDGHIELTDTSSANVQVTKEHLDGRSFTDLYELGSPLEPIKICPDFGGATLEGMIGLSIERKFRPIFGDHQFLNYFATAAENLQIGRLVAPPLSNHHLSEIVDLGVPMNSQDLYRYSSDPKFFSIVRRIGERSFAAGSKEQDPIGVIFDSVSMTVDAVAGAPITSVPKLAYDAYRAVVRKGTT